MKNNKPYLTNEFKNLQVEETKPIRKIVVSEYVIAMVIVMAILYAANELGWIEVAKKQF